MPRLIPSVSEVKWNVVRSVVKGSEQTPKLIDRHDRPSKQHTLNLDGRIRWVASVESTCVLPQVEVGTEKSTEEKPERLDRHKPQH